ncbi:CAF17-like 4Fe-4S cluster assembly/insertion protein YgfZ [Crateriforma spongiae]|uniref:CAF17-like 4Fe-4S cluster assembly/insertion protein YgfZ n=1 Tax=Crateriforma spongiae TaxID=2724528 RepID=UPI001F37E8EF|nr:hypothetical protein [Crateriforma spongiae]
MIYVLNQPTIVDLCGADADQILHNLTTADVRALAVGQGCESFITDVRGKTLHHVMVYRTDQGFRLVGPGGESAKDPQTSFCQRLVDHCDRYIIREDATPTIVEGDWRLWVADPESAAGLNDSWHDCSWLGPGSRMCWSTDDASVSLDGPVGDQAAFHWHRVIAGFPWYGIDLDDSNLPQEADRDSQTISFTKGCYLGQETVARLDALGQVQRKLVHWAIGPADDSQTMTSGDPEPVAVTVPTGTTLLAGAKKVARLTSLATLRPPNGVAESAVEKFRSMTQSISFPVAAVAMGFARRSHFDPGARAEGSDAAGQPIQGEVLAVPHE